MSAALGVWIDSREALIVPAETAGPHGDAVIRRVASNKERQLRLSSGERGKTSYGPQAAPADDMRETSSNENLHAFLDEVVAAVRGAGSIFIFGPGEPKEELKKRLERAGLGGRIDGLEAIGRLSDRRLAAKVREHFRRAGDPGAPA